MSIKLKVHGVLTDPNTEKQVAILKGDVGNEIIPVWISAAEGNSIRLGLEGIIPGRPMSHDLLKDIISNLKAAVEKIVLKDVKTGVLGALIHIDNKGTTVVMDSGPGDAISLALRANAPIYISEQIMDKRGAKNLDDWLKGIKKYEKEGYDA